MNPRRGESRAKRRKSAEHGEAMLAGTGSRSAWPRQERGRRGVAIFHLDVKAISRATGRSGTAAAAYRSAERIVDERTGEVFDYARRRGVEHAAIFVPEGAPEWAHDRAALWNAAEAAEKRKDAQVAREVILALPHELSPEERQELATDFCRWLVERHGVAVDLAIHEPHRKGDERNHHAHVLMSTRRLEGEGFTAKTRELNDRATSREHIAAWREEWEAGLNRSLERAGRPERVDCRSHADRGDDREPMLHMGPEASAMERRGFQSRIGDENREREARNAERRRERPEPGPEELARRARITKLWQRSDTGAAFAAALEAEGLTLCQGDRRPFVILDERGRVHSAARLIEGVKTADLRERLADVPLPNLDAMRQERQQDERERLALLWRGGNVDGFLEYLKGRGMELCRGERSAFVILNEQGRAQSATRLIEGVTVRDIRDRIGARTLRTVSQVKDALALEHMDVAQREKLAAREATRTAEHTAAAEIVEPWPDRGEVTQLWRSSDSGEAFLAGLSSKGMKLCEGYHGELVILDGAGRQHTATRLIDGANDPDMRDRLGERVLPTVQQARDNWTQEQIEAAAREKEAQRAEAAERREARAAEAEARAERQEKAESASRSQAAARAAEKTADKGLHVAGAVVGKAAEKLTDFVAGIFEGLMGAPPQKSKTFTVAQLLTDPKAENEHRLAQLAKRDRDEALDRIAEDIKGGKNLDHADVPKLSYDDLEGIRAHGDAHVEKLLREREEERKREREQSQGRTRKR